MSNISFEAKYKCNEIVASKGRRGKYKKTVVSVLSLSKTDADKKTIEKLASKWENGNSYVPILTADYFENNSEGNKNVFFITEQTDKFHKLSPEKILGIAELEKMGKSYKINYMQVRTDCQYDTPSRPFKKIGSTLLDFLISLTEDANVYLNAVPKLMGYYKKFGFEVQEENLREPLMILRKSKPNLDIKI